MDQATKVQSRSKRLSLTKPAVVEMIENQWETDAGMMDDASNHRVLDSTWAFWFDQQRKKGLKREAFEAEIKQGTPFSTISQFWTNWNQVQSAVCSPLRSNTNINVFKEGIKPLWEDPANRKGGKFQITMPKNSPCEETLKVWLYLVVSVILGELGSEQEINGLVLSTRSWGNTFSIWTQSVNEVSHLDHISEKLREIFGVEDLKFQRHKNSLKKNRVVRANQRKEGSVSPPRSDDESSDLHRSSSSDLEETLEVVSAPAPVPVVHINATSQLSMKDYLLLYKAHAENDVRDSPSTQRVSCH